MNYIAQIKAFYDRLEENPLSTSAIALWHALMYANNKVAWDKEFSMAASILCFRTGMSERTLSNARNELKIKGYLDFRSRKGNQSAIYSMFDLSESLSAIDADKLSISLPNSFRNVSDNASGNPSTLIKELITTTPAITTTTTRGDPIDSDIDPKKTEPEDLAPLIALQDAYCDLHNKLAFHLSQRDVSAMKRVISAGIPSPFIYKAMHAIYQDKKRREEADEGGIFSPPNGFTYYESAIIEAWQKHLAALNGGANSDQKTTRTNQGGSGGRKHNGHMGANNGALTVPDDELDKLIATSTELQEV